MPVFTHAEVQLGDEPLLTIDLLHPDSIVTIEGDTGLVQWDAGEGDIRTLFLVAGSVTFALSSSGLLTARGYAFTDHAALLDPSTPPTDERRVKPIHLTLYGPDAGSTPSTEGIRYINEARQHQLDLGYTLEHDVEHHSRHDLLMAAQAYLALAMTPKDLDGASSFWPWDPSIFHSEGIDGDLARAGALITAAIDHYIETTPA